MKTCRQAAAHAGAYLAALGKWLAVGALIGGVGGAIGSLFHIGVHYAAQARADHPWILYLLPVLGAAIALLYRLAGVEGKDTNTVIESVHFGKDVPIALVPVIFASTVLTHLGGGSAGREGAALQIGGGVGYRAGRLLHLGEKDLPLATLCGMSAVFSALFGTPVAATVFAMEVVSVGAFYYAGLIPCLTAALTGYGVSVLMGVPPTRFVVAAPALEVRTVALAAVLAAACAAAKGSPPAAHWAMPRQAHRASCSFRRGRSRGSRSPQATRNAAAFCALRSGELWLTRPARALARSK